MTIATEILKEAGIVTTRQRTMLLHMIRNRYDHPDAEGMFLTAREQMPQISVDTVYRTLNLFAESGVIQRLAVPTRRARFDGSTKPHNHFLCTECEKIADLPPGRRRTPIPQAVKRLGRIDEVQNVYIGVCKSCLQSNHTISKEK